MYNPAESTLSIQQEHQRASSRPVSSSKPFALKNPRVSKLSSSLLDHHQNGGTTNTLLTPSTTIQGTEEKFSPEEHSCNEFIAKWSSSFNENDEYSEKLINVLGGSSYASTSSSSTACSFVSSTTASRKSSGHVFSNTNSGGGFKNLLDEPSTSPEGGISEDVDPESSDHGSDKPFRPNPISTRPRSFTTSSNGISITSPHGGTAPHYAARRLSKSLKIKSKLSSRLSAAKLHISARSAEGNLVASSTQKHTPPSSSPLSSLSKPLVTGSSSNSSLSSDESSSDSTQSASQLEPADKTPSTGATTAMSNFRESPFSAEKQERLLIFLLARSFQDPQEMNLVCDQLVENGYLSEQALDPTFRKNIIQSFLLNTLLEGNGTGGLIPSPHNPISTTSTTNVNTSSKMRRSRSASSFFDLEQSPPLSNSNSNMSAYLTNDLDIPALLTKTQQQQYLTSLPPFLASLPYTTSRFRSDFCEPILLGKGGFGSVYKVSHRIDGREYAIKRVKFCFKNPEQLRVAYEKVIREVRTLSSMDEHSGIVRYHNAWFEPFLHDGLDTLASEEGDTNDGSTSFTPASGEIDLNTPEHSSGVSDTAKTPSKRTVVMPLEQPKPQASIVDPNHGRLYFNSPPQDGIFEMDDMDYDYDDDYGANSNSGAGAGYSESGEDSEQEHRRGGNGNANGFSAKLRENGDFVTTYHDVLQTIGAPHSGVKFDVCDDDDSTSSSPNSHVVGVPESPSFHDPVFMSRFEQHRNINPGKSRARRSLQLQPHHQMNQNNGDIEDGRRNSLVCRENSPPTHHGTAPTAAAAGPNIDQPHVRNVLQTAFSNGKFHMILCIQMQLCTTVTLEDWLWSPERQNNRMVDMDKVVSFMHQILDAVCHMHETGIIHRDIKPSNIFVTKDETLKIGDFGLAKTSLETASTTEPAESTHMGHRKAGGGGNRAGGAHHPSRAMGHHHNAVGKPQLFRQNTKYAGTQTYAAPEQIMGTAYDEKVDIFSLGIMFFEMFHPFSTRTERVHVISDLRRGVIPASIEEKHPEEMVMIRRCLAAKPADRPSANDLISFLNRRFGGKVGVMGHSVPSSVKNLLEAKDERIRELEEKIRLLESQS